MAGAADGRWLLLRRSIDPEARFKFVPAQGYRPKPGELRFDMFEAQYTHAAFDDLYPLLRQEASALGS